MTVEEMRALLTIHDLSQAMRSEGRWVWLIEEEGSDRVGILMSKGERASALVFDDGKRELLSRVCEELENGCGWPEGPWYATKEEIAAATAIAVREMKAQSHTLGCLVDASFDDDGSLNWLTPPAGDVGALCSLLEANDLNKVRHQGWVARAAHDVWLEKVRETPIPVVRTYTPDMEPVGSFRGYVTALPYDNKALVGMTYEECRRFAKETGLEETDGKFKWWSVPVPAGLDYVGLVEPNGEVLERWHGFDAGGMRLYAFCSDYPGWERPVRMDGPERAEEEEVRR